MTNEEALKQIESHIEWKKPFWMTVKAALEKQIPKKPLIGGNEVFACRYDYKDYRCPRCGDRVYEEDYEGYGITFYPACKCGQIIDWEDVYKKLWEDEE